MANQDVNDWLQSAVDNSLPGRLFQMFSGNRSANNTHIGGLLDLINPPQDGTSAPAQTGSQPGWFRSLFGGPSAPHISGSFESMSGPRPPMPPPMSYSMNGLQVPMSTPNYGGASPYGNGGSIAGTSSVHRTTPQYPRNQPTTGPSHPEIMVPLRQPTSGQGRY